MGRHTAEEQREKRLLKKKEKILESAEQQCQTTDVDHAPPEKESSQKPNSKKSKENSEKKNPFDAPKSVEVSSEVKPKRKRKESTQVAEENKEEAQESPSKPTEKEFTSKQKKNKKKRAKMTEKIINEKRQQKDNKPSVQSGVELQDKKESEDKADTHASKTKFGDGGKNDTKQDKGKGRDKKGGVKGKMRYTCFFGQLPFDTTRDMLTEELKKLEVQHDRVRLMTDTKTKLFRGIAFADFPTEAERRKALKMHHTEFRGRKINVERVDFNKEKAPPAPDAGKSPKSSNSKSTDSKTDKKSKFAKKMTEPEVEILIRNQVAESKGALKREDFDPKNISFLSLLHKPVAERALKEVAKRAKNSKVKNRQAYFMGVILRVSKDAEAIAAKATKERESSEPKESKE